MERAIEERARTADRRDVRRVGGRRRVTPGSCASRCVTSLQPWPRSSSPSAGSTWPCSPGRRCNQWRGSRSPVHQHREIPIPGTNTINVVANHRADATLHRVSFRRRVVATSTILTRVTKQPTQRGEPYFLHKWKYSTYSRICENYRFLRKVLFRALKVLEESRFEILRFWEKYFMKDLLHIFQRSTSS